MMISPDILRRDTVQLLNQIDAQITEVQEKARELDISPVAMRDNSGNWVMIPLLLAKVQAYSTLVQLQAKK